MYFIFFLAVRLVVTRREMVVLVTRCVGRVHMCGCDAKIEPHWDK
jgi:hypothetical protein